MLNNPSSRHDDDDDRPHTTLRSYYADHHQFKSSWMENEAKKESSSRVKNNFEKQGPTDDGDDGVHGNCHEMRGKIASQSYSRVFQFNWINNKARIKIDYLFCLICFIQFQ